MKSYRGLLVLILVLGFGSFALLQLSPNSMDAEPSAAGPALGAAPMQLEVVAQVGPWPVASRLVGYRGKLWFANSVKGINHNSADIWSFDPATGNKRYERHLFSQDAGFPLVYKGLLYWPFEDALLSSGQGVIEVTDGETWQPLTIANPPIYHTSQLLEWQGGLLAITGTRNAGMQLSSDAGRSWEEFYIHPTPQTHVSRLKEMLVFKGKTYASLKDDKVKRLVTWTGAGFRTVGSWPLNRYFNGLTVHNDELFGIVGRGREREIWKFDGKRSIRVDFKGPFTDLTSDGDELWIVSRDGKLWSSPQGDKWVRHGDLKNGRPVSIQAVAKGIYVAGAGDDGRGIVWGPRGHSIPNGAKPPPVIPPIPAERIDVDWNRLGQKIDKLLSDGSTYGTSGSGEVGEWISHAVAQGAPSGFFAERLKTQIPSVQASVFAGNRKLPAQDIADILLLSAMEQSGHPNVPIKYLTDPWGSQPNSYEKYFEVELNAMRAVVGSSQSDSATINALLVRLDFSDDPPWLKSQVIGTLTAVSGEHFGYDIASWKKWASRRRQDLILND